MKSSKHTLYESIMKDISKVVKKSLTEAYMKTVNADDRAVIGNILEVELKDDGKFYWHTPNESKFKSMKDWEINTDEMPRKFFIKIGY